MRTLSLLVLLATALAAPAKPSSAEVPSPSATVEPPVPTTEGIVITGPAEPSPTAPTDPGPSPSEPAPTAPAAIENTWGRGFVDPADFIEGNYIDGYEYLQWAWALIYRPVDNGTFCLTTYTQESVPAAMVAYIADSREPGSAALLAGTSASRVGAACVKGVDASCVDVWAQWGNISYVGKEVHCFACGDASHGPGAE